MRLKLYRGKWYAVWRENGVTKRLSLRASDRAAAERQLRDLKTERPGDTVAEIMEAYLAEKKGVARSHASMEAAWRALKPTFGSLRPDQINRLLCRSYARMRRTGGVKDGTVIKDLGVLKAALGWAKKADKAVFEMPHTPPPRERYLTRDEFERLLAACEQSHIALFIMLALATAGRASALFELTWDRVDFERGQVRLAKGEGRRKGRATVTMNDRLRAALETAYEGRTSSSVIEWGGEPVKTVKRSFARACRVAGIEGVTPHTLRHTAAVWMAEAGISIPEIAQFLGHGNVATTFKTYARYSPEHLRKAANVLQ